MDYYVVMVNEEQFVRLRDLQQEIDAGPETREAIYHDAWAACTECGERCEYGEAVELDSPCPGHRAHSHGIVHPECAAGEDG